MAAAAFAYRTKSDSSSDSDSDASDTECKDWKRATRKTNEEVLEKIPIVPPPTVPEQQEQEKPAAPKRKRNNIWYDVLQDQMMSETLGHCGLKKKPKGYGSRGEESYDYTLGYKNSREEDEDSDEIMSEDEKSKKLKISSGKSYKFKHSKNPSFVKLDGAEADAAKKIIKTLAEQKKYLIYRIVKFAGIEKAMQLLQMTEDIEENGGMMIHSNQRRRTPGGVYLQLLKADKDMEKGVLDKIFEGEYTSFDLKRMADERKKKKKLAAAKKALLKNLEKEIQSKQNGVEESKEEDNSVAMEDEDVEETSVNHDIPQNSAMQISSNDIPQNSASKDSDLEDGEIED